MASRSNSSAGRHRAAHLVSATAVLERLRVRRDQGLSTDEVHRRYLQQGFNIIPRHRRHTRLRIFLDRFTDILVLFLITAAIISLLLKEYADAIIIALAILIDITLSFIQVWRAERTLERLRQHVQQTTTVLRDGRLKTIPARELVVGDIIAISAGEKIPADARLIKTEGFRAHEAALTGESRDVGKTTNALVRRAALGDRDNMVYMGTIAMSGNAQAVVTATGTRTEFGKIAQVLKSERSPTSPLRKKLQRLGTWISIIITVAVLFFTIANLLSGDSIANSARTAITLIVSAIPEDLIIILTVALTVGMIRILKKKGVVRQLSSTETLGAATVICTDKTGTLTIGAMHAEHFDFMQGDIIRSAQAPQNPLHALAFIGLNLASAARRIAPHELKYLGSATERTALAFAESLGLNQINLRTKWRRRAHISFSPEWKYRASLHDHPTKSNQTLFVSGAPDIILEKSSRALDPNSAITKLTSARRFEITRRLKSEAAKGKRLLAIAIKRDLEQDSINHQDISNLTFLGILVITDPVRPEVRPAIKDTLAAGVAIKVITGDYLETARAVARDIGLTVTDDAVINGDILQSMSDAELQFVIDDIVIFARVNPIDKQRIVRALQAKGHIVAMTGDGVNDAVALKSADIGVAMGSGKDIAKDASDLVLLDDNFATIVAAIKEGRVVRDNVRKVISFLLATNAAEVAIFIASLGLRLPLPMLPAQILWINLVTDGTADLALALEPQERNVMTRPPEHPSNPIINKRHTIHIIFAGIAITITAMGLYWYLFNHLGSDLTYTRTMIFSFVAVVSLLSTWSYRSLNESIFKRGLWQNPWLIASAAFSFALHLLAIYTPLLQSFFHTVPLTMNDWALIFILSLITLLVIDLRKIMPLGQNVTTTSPQKPALVTASPTTNGTYT